MSTWLVSVPGVLQAADRTPIVEGKLLVRALIEYDLARVVLVVADREAGRRFLRQEGLTADDVMVGDVLEAANALRANGGTLRGTVVADPDVARELHMAGHTVMLFSHPRYALPEWRPDYQDQVIPWDQLAAEIGWSGEWDQAEDEEHRA